MVKVIYYFLIHKKIAEIYKIHGCSTDPKSLVLTKDDYDEFKNKNSYLASKLLSIFLEHPVFFIGYSLNDENIASILGSISQIMRTNEQREKIAKNLIFVSRAKGNDDSISETHLGFLDNKSIPITQVRTDDFSKVYSAFQGKERKIPAHILRIFREQFYEIVQGESPEKKLYCPTDIDEIIKSGGDVEFVAGFGVAQKGYSEVGLKGINFKMILADAIYGDLKFDRTLILKNSLDDICKTMVYVPIQGFIKSDITFIPLKNASESFKDLFRFNEQSFTAKIAKNYRKSYKSKNLASLPIDQIIDNSLYSEPIRMDYLAQYIVDNNSTENLEVLKRYLKNQFDVQWNCTNFKRLVCVYDCLVNK